MLTGHTLASNGFLLATTFALIECLAFQKFSPNGAIVFYPALTGLGIIGMVAIFPGRCPRAEAMPRRWRSETKPQHGKLHSSPNGACYESPGQRPGVIRGRKNELSPEGAIQGFQLLWYRWNKQLRWRHIQLS